MPRTVVVDPQFGRSLRRLRTERGLTYRACGDLAKVSHTYVWELEVGKKPPTVEIAKTLDATLAADGALAALVCEAPSPLNPDDEERLAQVAAQPRRVDRETLDGLRTVLAEQRRREDQVGSGAVLPVAHRHLTVVRALVGEAPSALRRATFDTAAQWAQFGGWLATAVGRRELAHRRFDRALEWAMIAGNRDMVSTVLSFRGYLAWLSGQVGLMIALTEAALAEPGVYVGQAAYDAFQQARGHAMSGEMPEAVAMVDRGGDLAAAAAEYAREIPPWHYYRLPAFFALERGLVYRYLGRTDGQQWNERAMEQFRAGLSGLPEDMRRAEWVGDYVYQLVLAHDQAGDLAGRAEALRLLRAIAEATASEQLSSRLERLTERTGGCQQLG